MVLRESLNGGVRTLYALIGLVLFGAVVASNWADWPLVLAGKSAPLGFWLINLIALPISLLVLLWAFVGERRMWNIAHDHVRVRAVSLSEWRRDERLDPREIEAVRHESYAYGDRHKRTAHWLVMRLSNGKTYRSPLTFDGAVIDDARRGLEAVIAQRS